MVLFSGWKSIAALVAVALVFGAASKISDNQVFLAVVLALSGVAVFLFGRAVNQPIVAQHPQTGEPATYRPRNGFFFIPLQYWGVLLVVLGVVTAVAS